MDFGRIVQMVINMLIRKAVSGGVNAALRQGGRKSAPVSPEDAEQARAARHAAKRARQALNITRRL